MPDPHNPGQFGNRSDTRQQASVGGRRSPGQFGGPAGADPHEAGRKGGQHSPGQFGGPAGADPHEAGRKGGHR